MINLPIFFVLLKNQPPEHRQVLAELNLNTISFHFFAKNKTQKNVKQTRKRAHRK